MEKIQGDNDFEAKKIAFFSRFASSLKEAFKTHKEMGLWSKEDSWKNVSEHCLVEAVRAKEFASLLKLSEEETKNLILAAVLHDVGKKIEIKALKESDGTLDTYDRIQDKIKSELIGYISSNVGEINSSIAHEGFFKDIIEILSKGELTERDISKIVMHYIDDYTIGSEWVVDASEGKNDLDRRVEKNEANKNYVKINLDGKRYFGGKTTYEMQREIGHAVEERLVKIMREKSGVEIDPVLLPEFIDKKIREFINAQNINTTNQDLL